MNAPKCIYVYNGVGDIISGFWTFSSIWYFSLFLKKTTSTHAGTFFFFFKLRFFRIQLFSYQLTEKINGVLLPA